MVSDSIGCAALALVAALAMYAWRLRLPLGADEGYLWYGVQQLRNGGVPHRDFKSYEPGRYLWCAAIGVIAGSGLAGLRASTHLFLALALAAALLVLQRLGLGWLALACAALAIASWSHPQHKQFEHGCLLAAWASQAMFLLEPTPLHCALAFGVCGVVLVFGFNLFLYVAAALVLELAIALLLGWLRADVSLAAVAASALAIGASPFLLLLVSRGFRVNFWRRRVASVLTRGTANLPLPRPWPWSAPAAQLPPQRQRAFAWLFLAMFVLPLLGLSAVLLLSVPRAPAAGMLAAAALAAFAAHHAASRADASHIAQSIAPCLLLLLSASAWLAPGWAAVALAVASAWLAWPLLAQDRTASAWLRWRSLGALRILLPTEMDALLERAQALCLAHPEKRAGLFVAPAYPAVYAMLVRDAPAYDTFCLYPADEATQATMIAQLQRARLFAAFVSDEAIDGREDLRFSRTHPRVWAFLQSGFRPTPFPQAGADVWLFLAEDAAQS